MQSFKNGLYYFFRSITDRLCSSRQVSMAPLIGLTPFGAIFFVMPTFTRFVAAIGILAPTCSIAFWFLYKVNESPYEGIDEFVEHEVNASPEWVKLSMQGALGVASLSALFLAMAMARNFGVATFIGTIITTVLFLLSFFALLLVFRAVDSIVSWIQFHIERGRELEEGQ